ncbi:MAG: group II intron maturase-specific domain-containing protein, partial [Chlamydiota bacterium]
FKLRIRQLTRGHHRKPMEERISDLNSYIRGWYGYFQLTETKKKLIDIDGWIRTRLRMCQFKRWWKARTRVKQMSRLGLTKEEARGYGQNKRYWHLANVYRTRFLMNKAYWEKMGYRGLEWNIGKAT